MKKLLRRLHAGSVGLLFQATVTFQPLTGGTNGSSGSSLAGPLAQWFNSSSLAGFFQATFNLAFSAGAILAVLRLSYAGWLYMSSDAFGKKTQAKEVITDAMLGLFLLIGIWIILNQINPCILNLNVLQTIQSGTTSCQS